MAVSSGVRKTLIIVATLVCVFGLLVGFAHWRVHELETGDVAWTAQAYDRPDEAVVVGGRIYTYDDDRLVIRDLRTGRTIAVRNAGGYQAYVGDGGQAAIADLTRDRLAFYSRDGKELWHHDGERPVAIGADGSVDVTACVPGSCHVVHYDNAGHMTTRTRVPDTIPRPETIGSAILGAEDHRVLRLPTVPVNLDEHRAQQLRGGRLWGPAVTTEDDNTLAQVGDLLVGYSQRDGACTFDAVRSGKHAWTTSASCPGLTFPRLVVFEHRLYAYNATDSGFDVVSTDLDGRRAVGFHIRAATPPKHGRRELGLTPDAAVLVTTSTISAYSPASGKKLWTRKMSRSSRDVLDESHRIYPGVKVSGNVIDMYEDTRPPWPQLAIGHHTPSTTHTFLDPATGDTTAMLATRSDTQISGTDDGDAIALDAGDGADGYAEDDRVRLVRP